MSTPHETLERAEHAAHSAHGGGHAPHASNKTMGITMAMIGVLIAFCAAMVGSERNELTRAMIEQTNANSIYTAASTKFRLVMLESEKQRADMESSARTSPERSRLVSRLVALYSDYARERDVSKRWAESYAPLVEAHFGAAEGYERAQLIAEIGVVIASLGVLLSNRRAWFLSILIALVCLAQLGATAVRTRSEVRNSLGAVEHGLQAYTDLRRAHVGAGEDERTLEVLDPGGKLRAAARAPAGSAAGTAERSEK